jgi:hypothetical protein
VSSIRSTIVPPGASSFVGGKHVDGVGVENEVADAGVALGRFLVRSLAMCGDLVDDADLLATEADFSVE